MIESKQIPATVASSSVNFFLTFFSYPFILQIENVDGVMLAAGVGSLLNFLVGSQLIPQSWIPSIDSPYAQPMYIAAGLGVGGTLLSLGEPWWKCLIAAALQTVTGQVSGLAVYLGNNALHGGGFRFN